MAHIDGFDLDYVSGNTVDMVAMLKVAIPINARGQVDRDDLTRIRNEISHSSLGLKHIGGFLRYARQVVESSMSRSDGRYDTAFAVVEYCNREFTFIPEEHASRYYARCRVNTLPRIV